MSAHLPHNGLISLNQAFLMRSLTTIVCDVPVDVDINGAIIEESGLDAAGGDS